MSLCCVLHQLKYCQFVPVLCVHVVTVSPSVAVARTCSLIYIVLDVLKPLQHKKLIEHELEGFGIRLNKEPPSIGFRKKEKGGVNLQTLVTICFP